MQQTRAMMRAAIDATSHPHPLLAESPREHTESTRAEQAARIIEQLEANHAANVAAGLSSPALEDFHRLTVAYVSEAADPWSTFAEITKLISEDRGSAATPERPGAATPKVRVHAADLQGETPVAVRDSLTRYDLAIDFSFPTADIAAALQEVLRDGMESGRWARVDTRLTPVQVAEEAISRAVLGSVEGLATNPHDVADRLAAAIENAQAEHLARPEVGGFPLSKAQGHEAFHTAAVAMARALALSGNRALTADGLRSALNMAIAEARG